MKATNWPPAFSTALLRVRAIFCRGSTQYVIEIVDRAANASTAALADFATSLSATTIEYVKRPSVACVARSSSSRCRNARRLNVQMHTEMCGVGAVIGSSRGLKRRGDELP